MSNPGNAILSVRIASLAISVTFGAKSDFEVSSGYYPGGRDLQLSERLFVLPEYNTATNLFMAATINDLMRRKDAVLKQIKSHDVVDLPKSQITTSSGRVVETDPILCQMEFSIALSDSIAGNLGGLAASLNAGAESGLQSLMPQIYSTLGQICVATGNTVDAKGGEFTHEMFLQMLERVDIHFEDDGSHNLSWVMTPEMFEKLSKLAEPTDEQNSAVAEIIERKRREFNARKRRRQLIGPQEN